MGSSKLSARPSRGLLDGVELGDDGFEPVVDQHVVSRVVLKGFADQPRSDAGWWLVPVDLELRRELKPRSVRGCAKEKNFIGHRSGSLERLWKATEDCLPQAIAAVRSGNLEPSGVEARTLKDGIALHFVRSYRYLDIHRNSLAAAMRTVPREVVRRHRAAVEAEFRKELGLYPAGPETLEWFVDSKLDQWREADAIDAPARDSLENMYERVREGLRNHAVEVCHVPDGRELLISDCPAFSFRHPDGSGDFLLNMAIGDSHGLAMPVSRDCLIAIGPADLDGTLSPDQVQMLNEVQIEIAHRFVYYGQKSRFLADFVQNVIKRPGRRPAC